jgi:hypothetical protein
MSNVFRPTRSVTLRGGAVVVVRELAWPDAMEFLSRLGSHARGLIEPFTGQSPDRPAIVRGLLTEISKLVGQARELGDFLLENAVERGPDGRSPVVGLGVADVLHVLREAVALNLSEEVLEAANALGKVVGGVFLSTTTTTSNATPPR